LRNILKNKHLNNALLENGYIKFSYFKGFNINKAFHRILFQNKFSKTFKGHQHNTVDVSYHSTFLDNNLEYKQLVKNELTRFFKLFVDDFFDDYKIIQTNIFNKPPNDGFVCPHQNLTTVDENKYSSFSIWVPLQNTNKENGTLYFLPKSHKKFEKYRNADIFWAPLSASNKIEDFNMIEENLSLGEVLVFDDSIIHASPKNNSSSDRLVFHCIVIPKEASAIYCNKKDNNMEIVEVDDDFWHFHTPNSQVKGMKVLEVIQVEQKKYDLSNLMNEMD